MSIKEHELVKPNCYKCLAFKQCLSAVLDESLEVKCLYYGWLQKQVKNAVDKLNSIGLPNPLSQDEVKAMVYYSNVGNMKE